MSGINKQIILGRVGKDPETRSLQNGGKVVSFSVATSDRWKDAGGQMQERTTWHQVVIFNERIGEVAEKYLRKGSEVYIEGATEHRQWQDQSGGTRYSTEVVLRQFRGELALVGGRGNGSGASDDDGAADSGATRGASARGNGRSNGASGGWGSDGGRGGGTRGGRAPAGSDLDSDIPFAPPWQ